MFNKVFHYKPSILGYPYIWKHQFCGLKLLKDVLYLGIFNLQPRNRLVGASQHAQLQLLLLQRSAADKAYAQAGKCVNELAFSSFSSDLSGLVS